MLSVVNVIAVRRLSDVQRIAGTQSCRVIPDDPAMVRKIVAHLQGMTMAHDQGSDGHGAVLELAKLLPILRQFLEAALPIDRKRSLWSAGKDEPMHVVQIYLALWLGGLQSNHRAKSAMAL